ncbi:MAG: hypothetical protein HYY18_03725 [Planctomycetes bacterium]|nr:hypothetical protein [Planctomycetota bacterium]
MIRILLLLPVLASVAVADADVFGQIVDSENRDGGVIDFAFLKLKAPEDLDGDPVAVKTDRTGRFTVKLAPGAYRVGDLRKPQEKDARLFEANYARDLIEVGSDAMYDLGILRLEKTGTYLKGRVTRGGKAVPAVDVEVFVPGAAVPTGQRVSTDSAGAYEMQFNDVRGRQRVAVRVEEKDGCTFGAADVDLWKPGAVDLALPEKYHEVQIDLKTPGETWMYLHPSSDPAPYYMYKAGQTSKVTVPGLSPGPWVLTAVSNGAQVNVELAVPAAAPVAVAIPAVARHRLSGKIAISGLPREADFRGMAVTARPAGEGPAGYLWTRLGRDGAYAFEGLAAGRYELSIASGTPFDTMRYFQVRRSAVLQSVLELSAPRTLEFTARAGDFTE